MKNANAKMLTLTLT